MAKHVTSSLTGRGSEKTTTVVGVGVFFDFVTAKVRGKLFNKSRHSIF